MARKNYNKDAKAQETPTTEEEQTTEKKPLSTNTILLAIILLFVVFQTYMMVTEEDDRPAATTNQMTGANNSPAPNANTTPPPSPGGGAELQQAPPLNTPPGQGGQSINQANGQSQPSSNAVAVYSENEIDLGSVPAGKKVKHTFKLQNTGTDPLVYGDVTADAGLVVVDGPETTIPPGGSGSITVELNTENMSGPVNKIVHVNSNAEPAHFHLEVKANVQ